MSYHKRRVLVTGADGFIGSHLAEPQVALTGTGKEIVAEQARLHSDKSEVRLLQADSSRFHAATGWAAAVAIDRGLELTVAGWRRRIQAGRLWRGTGFATRHVNAFSPPMLPSTTP